jgi:hypothetical protein
MANIIQYKRSDTPDKIPNSGDLQSGELAINTADAKLFTKKTDDTVVQIRTASTPVGFISPAIINRAFSAPDWLICNGGVYAKSSYPALAALLGDNMAVSTGSLPVSANWNAFAQGGGVYVAIAISSRIVVRSTDGANWTQSAMPASLGWLGCAWNGSVFCAISSFSQSAVNSATSPDGITWTARSLFPIHSWSSIVWTGSQFVAISRAGVAATSADGINWTLQTILTGVGDAIAYGNGLIVVVSGGLTIVTSPDGVTWTERRLPSSASTISWTGSFFVALGTTSAVSISADGISWFLRYMPAARFWNTRLNGASQAIAGATAAAFAMSSDGIFWREFPLPFSGLWKIAFWTGTKFIGLASNTSNYISIERDTSNFVVPAITTNIGGFASGYLSNHWIKT